MMIGVDYLTATRIFKYLKKKTSEIWSIIRADFSFALNFLNPCPQMVHKDI